MALELTENQLNIIKSIAGHEGIFSYKLEIKNAMSEGDGYSGSLLSITLKTRGNNFHLILKQAKKTDNIALKTFRRKSYLREIYVYNKVIPEFEQFQKKFEIIEGFSGFAKIYGSCDKENSEFLLLENLKETGFKMWNRRIPMNDEHLMLVFKEYGKFHAISLAMREKGQEIYNELEKNLGDYYSSALPRDDAVLTIKYKIEVGLEAVKNDKEVAQLFERFVNVAETFLLDDINCIDDHLVIMHADCWCNNFLFKYKDADETQSQTKLCFIDWQLSKIGSPVLDLAYFFFVCAAGDSLHHYNRYLKIYHNAVSESLSKFSCDVEKLFPYELLERHWRKYAKYGLYALLMTVRLMLYETDDENNCNSDTEKLKSQNRKADCNKRIVDVINVMGQYNLI